MKSPQLQRFSGSPRESMTVGRALSAVWSRGWIVGICLVLGGALGAGYLYLAPKTYSATALLKYQPQPIQLFDFSGLFADETSGPTIEVRLNEIRRNLLGEALLRQVAEQQKLAGKLSLLTGRGGLSTNTNTDAVVDALQQRVEVEIPPDDSIVAVSVRLSDAALAATVANALAEAAVARNAESREEIIESATTQLQSIRVNLEREWQESAKSAGAGDDQKELARQRELSQILADLNQSLVTAGLRALQLRTEVAEAKKQGDNTDDLLRIPSIAEDPGVASVRSRLVQKQVDFGLLRNRYKEKHPLYIEAESELASLSQALSNSVLTAVRQLDISLAAAEENQRLLQQQFGTQSSEAAEVARTLAVSTNSLFARQIQVSTELHDKVVQRLKEATLAGTLFQNPLSVSKSATAPVDPIDPSLYLVLASALVGGLVVGLFCALLVGLADTSIRSVDEAEFSLEMAVLSVIPRLRNTDTEQAAAEAFRSLRTSISVLSKGKDPKSLLFTSTSPDEGKTFCALNYSVGLARQGLKVALIECDLRRPRAAPSLAKVRVGGPGVSDYLRDHRASTPAHAGPRPTQESERGLSFAELSRKREGRADQAEVPTGLPSVESPASTPADEPEPVPKEMGLDQVLQRTEIENLFFVSAGRRVNNPSELLVQKGIQNLVADLLTRCDRVVIDSAPMLGVSDTLLLASQVDGVCFVLRANVTPRRAVTRAIEVLRRADAPVLGLILNGLVPKKSDPYGKDYYYHRTVERESAS